MKRNRACCAERVASIVSVLVRAIDGGIEGFAWFGDFDEHPERRRL